MQEPVLGSFARSAVDRQQRLIDSLPEGELRNTAIAIHRRQAEAFTRDAFAAGTTLYSEVGPPMPINDVDGRLRQARQIAQLRGGIVVAPFIAGELADMRRIMTEGGEAEKQAVRATLADLPPEMTIGEIDGGASTRHLATSTSLHSETSALMLNEAVPSPVRHSPPFRGSNADSENFVPSSEP